MGDEPITNEELEDILEHEQEDHTGEEPVEVPTDPTSMDLFTEDVRNLWS